MHDVTMAKEILRIAFEKAKGKKIVSLKIELGEDGHTTAESLSEALSLLAVNTGAEGCKLEITKSKDLETRLVSLDIK